jgi:hypothetical protein
LLEKIETEERRQLSEEWSGKEENFFFMDSSSSVPAKEVNTIFWGLFLHTKHSILGGLFV